jgi:hypothetical protein
MPSEILSARQIHALIAAGLGNPGLLDLWRRDPATLSRAGIEPLDIDLEALRRFSGLATKVRHPDLRDTLPLTFRSLECAGLEIDAFAGYTAIATTLRRVKTTTLSDKVSAFVTFLESWLDVDDPDHLLIEHISRHEAALARLKHQITIGGTAIEGGGGWPTAQTIVRICGTLILCEFALDPCRASEMVPPGVKALPRLPRKRFRLGYWWNGRTPEIQIIELDELGFRLLSLADGYRSVEAVAALLLGTGIAVPPASLFGPLKQLADLKVVAMI